MYEINEQLLLAIVNYLGQQPFNEVYGLMTKIQELTIKEVKVEEKKK